MSNPKNSSNTNTSDSSLESMTDREKLYSFSEQGKGTWQVQDDVVMGGRSDSQLEMTDDKHAKFSGHVSLENNGGFCSIHQITENNPFDIDPDAVSFSLLLKGDGKDYNFRVRTPNGRHSYAFTFPTKKGDDWETINIPFAAMEATYRGESVDAPAYNGEKVVEMQLLIGNKKEETFEILLESIEAI